MAATLPLPPLTSSTNSKQTFKSTISLLVFPSDGAAEHSSQSPAHATTEQEKQKNSISKRHIGTCVVCECMCVGVCMCAVTLQGHTRNTVSGSSEVSPVSPVEQRRGR